MYKMNFHLLCRYLLSVNTTSPSLCALIFHIIKLGSIIFLLQYLAYYYLEWLVLYAFAVRFDSICSVVGGTLTRVC